MSRTRFSRLFTSSLIAATLMAIVPASFGATVRDIEHISNASGDPLRRGADHKARLEAREKALEEEQQSKVQTAALDPHLDTEQKAQ